MVIKDKIFPGLWCGSRLSFSAIARVIAPITAVSVAIASMMIIGRSAIAVGSKPIGTETKPIHPSESPPTPDLNPGCPNEITPLAQAFLEDFPSYYNRTLIRSRIPGESASSTRVVLASEPDILSADDLADFSGTAIEGFFFTTLERSYREGQLVQQQGFHQIFLTRDVVGWLVVMTRSGYGDYPSGDRMTPPRASGSGLLAQTLRTWLRDCESR